MEYAERIAEFARRLPKCTESRIVIERISPDLTERDGLPAPHDLCRSLSGERIVFHADPGLNFHIAAAASVLPEETTFLHADTDNLYRCAISRDANGHIEESWKTYPLEDLGLKSLFALYGTRVEILDMPLHRLIKHLRKTPIPAEVRSSLHFSGITKPKLDLAYERRGRLYGLIAVDGSSREERRQKVHDIEQYQRLLPRPYLTILSDNETILRNAELQGHWTIPATGEEGVRRLQAWLAKEVPSPGVTQDTGRKWEEPVAIERYRRDDWKSGGGKPLALCLGDDPSATLISLCTHWPQRTILFYDAHTPKIVEKAGVIRKWAHRLPVGTIDFVPTDHLGRGIRRWLSRENEEIRVDITPGTKAQSVALMTARRGEVWHLRNDLGAAKALLGSEKKSLIASDLLTQAWIMAGEIVDEGMSASDLEAVNPRMLDLLGRFLTDYLSAKEGESISFSGLRNMSLGNDCVKVDDSGASSFSKGGRKRSGSAPLSPHWVPVDVHWGKKHETGYLPLDGGYWFELLVGNAFHRAGVEEIRISMKLGWPTEEMARHVRWRKDPQSGQHVEEIFHTHNRAELDVVGRTGHRFLIVSCKVGKTEGGYVKVGKTEEDYVKVGKTEEDYVREIEAVARIFGRFTIPILARPWVDPKTVEESVAARGGVVRLGIREIAEPARLREILQKVFKARRLG
ncbi:MAG: hypothetical protein D6795_00970 [Deltaproteobacteria bacterium]|nr:MAG: hypothetical protein D6795_00970 [Deltaproteobacteria bacterium]